MIDVSIRIEYQLLKGQMLAASAEKERVDKLKEALCEKLRVMRIALFGPESLRATAVEIQCSAAFLSELERGTRWSDEIVGRYVELLEAASK